MLKRTEEKTTAQRAVLVAIDTGEYDVDVSLAELSELAATAGAEVIAVVTQKRDAFDRATLIGKGKLEEIGEFASANEANLIILDHELTASQIRNISDCVEAGVIDRTMLILDIFAGRARTKEGRLQVELAQLRYRLPRLAGQGKSLSRLGGGIGTRGPGETKLESDRRHIRSRVRALEVQLEAMEKRRKHLRDRRKKDGVVTVAIAGYTNVGKSTLMNTLTDAGVLAEDKLFATLDPTARSLKLPDGQNVMLVDTVGLIRRLPHHLVNAFHSTLEEAVFADLLLNVCDASDPKAEEQMTVTRELMTSLGIAETPMLTVMNKCDLLGKEFGEELLFPGKTVRISARTGEGVDQLLHAIQEGLTPAHARMRLLVPYEQGGFLSRIRKSGRILSETCEEDGIHLLALVDKRLVQQAGAFLSPDDSDR